MIFNRILDSRENRFSIQKSIIHEYKKSLISFTLNTPGINKDSPQYRKIHEIGMERIICEIERSGNKIEYIKSYYKNTGPEGYLVTDLQATDLKNITLNIEERHPLGRIFDIDVFDKDHNQVGRSDIGEEARKCLICNKYAKICMREKKHSYQELVDRIDKMIKEYVD